MPQRLLLIGGHSEIAPFAARCAALGLDATSLFNPKDTHAILREAANIAATTLFPCGPRYADATIVAAAELGLPVPGVFDPAALVEIFAGADALDTAFVSTTAEATTVGTRLGEPLWVRPAVDPGGECAQHVRHAADIGLACIKARKHAVEGVLLVQSVATGDHYLVIGAVGGDQVFPVGIAALTIAHGAVPMRQVVAPETGGTSREALLERAATALRALRGARGIFEVECVVQGGAVRLVHLRVLPWANPAITALAEAASGVDLRGAALQVACGLIPDLAPGKALAACRAWLDPRPGLVTRVGDCAVVRAMPGVLDAHCHARPGSAIRHINSISARDRGGWVTTNGATADEAATRADAALAALHIVTTPGAGIDG